MKPLSFDFDWESPEQAKGPELRATWSRLVITVNDHVVTRVYDHRVKTVRDGVYGPLYPLAEWLASHWFLLLQECETPGRNGVESYKRRHGIRFAGEGYALPDLEFRPEGARTCLEWKAFDAPHQNVRFLESGRVWLDVENVRDAIGEFLDNVSARLASMAPSLHTPLEEEWEAIKALTVGEREFCEVAATLGLDPFDLSEDREKQIIATREALPDVMISDFFSAARYDQLPWCLEWTRKGLQDIASARAMCNDLRILQRKTRKCDPYRTPWEVGYECAMELRQIAGLRNAPVASDELRKLGFTNESVIFSPKSPSGFDALVGENSAKFPGFVVAHRGEESRRFAFSRALFEYLYSDRGTPSLVSRAKTDRQKRNRAFAAELLAPAAALRARFQGDSIGQDMVEDFANEFGVSSYVIQHQIENHQLARIILD